MHMAMIGSTMNPGNACLKNSSISSRRAGEDAAHQVAQREERRREKRAALFVHPGKCLAEKLRVVFACSGAIVIAFDDGGEVLL